MIFIAILSVLVCLSQGHGVDILECYYGQTRMVAGSCTKYEKCEYGRFVAASCSSKEHFDGYSCVYGACPKATSPSPPTSPSPSPTTKPLTPPTKPPGAQEGGPCIESGGLDGFARVVEDCSQYFQCVHGKWMKRPCGPGTVFNIRYAVCDWSYNVPECM